MGSMASAVTADLLDSNEELIKSGELRVLDPIFKIYGRKQIFSGPVVTLKVSNENGNAREILETRGEGRVLVIDGGGSKRCALLGGTLTQLAHDMGWAGIVVNGYIRDVSLINNIDIGVRAFGSNPLKPKKFRTGEKNVAVPVAGSLIFPGEWIYADCDGVIVSKNKLTV
ncbi:hypothetical protein LUZ61_011641 [Rhynchospora tenuis]|uniref:4-hydroxy-4-methyl-2-oxoglutarate aldolase n=1 Tax=Rhynchospora tenuis TaxID=198213 RepID=A0AAD6F0G0_9POAL|nr:hypothetical protein LUZ61_011641 [Rhynchospora tenuis]